MDADDRDVVVVSDTSVLIDLERGSLLEAAFRLPFAFAVPDLLYERELKAKGGSRLRELGLQIAELDGDGVAKAVEYRKRVPALSLPDCFALALAVQGSWAPSDRRCEAAPPRQRLPGGLPRPALAARRNALGRRCDSASAPRRPRDRQGAPKVPTAQGESWRAAAPVCRTRRTTGWAQRQPSGFAGSSLNSRCASRSKVGALACHSPACPSAL